MPKSMRRKAPVYLSVRVRKRLRLTFYLSPYWEIGGGRQQPPTVLVKDLGLSR